MQSQYDPSLKLFWQVFCQFRLGKALLYSSVGVWVASLIVTLALGLIPGCESIYEWYRGHSRLIWLIVTVVSTAIVWFFVDGDDTPVDPPKYV